MKNEESRSPDRSPTRFVLLPCIFNLLFSIFNSSRVFGLVPKLRRLIADS